MDAKHPRNIAYRIGPGGGHGTFVKTTGWVAGRLEEYIMKRIIFSLVAIVGVAGAANAQTIPGTTIPVPPVPPITLPLDPAIGQVDIKTPNPNVTKIDGTILGSDVKVIQNPAQTNIKVRTPEGDRAMVRLPSDADSIDDATSVKVKAADGTKVKVKAPK
jgi:hypothetical protein